MNNEQLQTSPSSARKWLLIGIGILVALVIAIVSTLNAQPGGALYGLKGSLENLSGEQTNGPRAAERQVSLMEKRLEETKKLAAKNDVSEKAMTDLIERMNIHLASMSEVVNQENEGADEQHVLAQLNRFASVAGAIEMIIENTPNLETYGETVEDIRRESVQLYKEKVDRFIEKAPLEQIYTYIKEQLADVSAQLDDPTISAGAIDDAENYLDRVATEMKKSDFPKVIVSIAEAFRFIQIDRYVGLTSSNEPIVETPSDLENNQGSSTPSVATTTIEL